MVTVVKGNLLAAHAEALVNTVNTVGVMGKGVALQFKQAYPGNFKAYESACKQGEVKLGRMFVTYTGMLLPRLIINFPTKGHWKGNSKIKDIESGLSDLIEVIKRESIGSIALPPLGCGLGGLRWEDVRPLIERAFESMPEVEVLLFAPGQAMAPAERIVRTAKPTMTAWRASLIKVVEAYACLGFEATHLEAQKLLYFLYRAGEHLKVNFAKGDYGPYDANMKYGLQAMDGHYLVGFGDGGRLEPVRLKEGASAEADQFIANETNSKDIQERIERVIKLIEGFETPYGLELLATLHWVAEQEGAKDADEAIDLAHSWNRRKAKALDSRHLRIAWQALLDNGWICHHVS